MVFVYFPQFERYSGQGHSRCRGACLCCRSRQSTGKSERALVGRGSGLMGPCLPVAVQAIIMASNEAGRR